MSVTALHHRIDVVPPVIQGGMGVGVSSWRLASAVARSGGLGVISGVAPDLLLARTLQDGDKGGHMRRALASYPDPVFAGQTLARFFVEGGQPTGAAYRPIPRLDLNQKIDAVRLNVLGAYAQVWLAREGHQGAVGMNLLEKVQLWTPAALLGAMLAGVDAVLVGAGVPRRIPRLLDDLAAGQAVTLPIDVDGAFDHEEYEISLDPRAVLRLREVSLQRPAFLAIISSHVLAAYLQRAESTAADGFVVEGFTAGGHNAPPRRPEIDASGQTVYTDRDKVDLVKMAALGQPFWLAGGYGTPAQLRMALAAGARGVQVGTPFALSHESGLRTDLRESMLAAVRDGSANVRTDPLASPTGFPFKVLDLVGTVTHPTTYAKRARVCDLGYLRSPFRRDDGRVGYRCPAEPEGEFVRKGGEASATVGRLCLCNGLTASAGFPQTRGDGSQEPPLLTLGADLGAAHELLARYPEGWSAAEVVGWLHEGLATS